MLGAVVEGGEPVSSWVSPNPFRPPGRQTCSWPWSCRSSGELFSLLFYCISTYHIMTLQTALVHYRLSSMKLFTILRNCFTLLRKKQTVNTQYTHRQQDLVVIDNISLALWNKSCLVTRFQTILSLSHWLWGNIDSSSPVIILIVSTEYYSSDSSCLALSCSAHWLGLLPQYLQLTRSHITWLYHNKLFSFLD